MHPPKPPSRAKVWGRRQWVHLTLSVVGLGMFVWCCVVVIGPQMARDAHRHGIGGWIAELFAPAPQWQNLMFNPSPTESRPYKSWTDPRIIIDDADGLRDHGTTNAITWSLFQYAEMGEPNACLVRSGYSTSTDGWWSLTIAHHQGAIEIENWANASGKEMVEGPNAYPWDFEAVRREYWRAMASEGRLDFPESVQALTVGASWSDRRMIASGYAINAATVLGLGMWVWCTPIIVRDAWRAWRRKPHMCATCGYDLRGLTTTVCPECGASTGRR